MLDQNEIDAKKDALIWAAKRCFELRLQTNAGGNLSVRLSSADAIVIKPSGVGFNECTRDNLQIVHLDGTLEPSPFKPSKDLGFHLDLYRIRPDINAIVHCHSPWATGYASAGLEIPCLTVQTIEKIGRMPLIPLSPNGGPQTEVEISPFFQRPQGGRRGARQPRDDRRGGDADQGAIPRRDHRRDRAYRLRPRHADGGPWPDRRGSAELWHRQGRQGGLGAIEPRRSSRRPEERSGCGEPLRDLLGRRPTQDRHRRAHSQPQL